MYVCPIYVCRAPLRQPSGLGPNGRSGQAGGSNGSNGNGGAANGAAGSGANGGGGGGGGQRGGADGGRRARYAATAKAPSWASEDWHPMKVGGRRSCRSRGEAGMTGLHKLSVKP